MVSLVKSSEIAAAKKGSEPALAAIIAKQMPYIRRIAWRVVRPGLDFDDAVQEGLIGLFRAIEEYDDSFDASFATYSSVCVRNAIFAASRTAGRKKHAPLNQSIPIPDGQCIPGPEEQTIANEQISITLEKARTTLSPFEKKVLQLRLDGYTNAQIAHKLDKEPKSVENALLRARKKLR